MGEAGYSYGLEQCDFGQSFLSLSELFCKMGTSILPRLWPGLAHTAVTGPKGKGAVSVGST